MFNLNVATRDNMTVPNAKYNTLRISQYQKCPQILLVLVFESTKPRSGMLNITSHQNTSLLYIIEHITQIMLLLSNEYLFSVCLVFIL